jgi:NAD(P)-dependent dehydrogenase (short-subunit alcohol dehydrogenase family)
MERALITGASRGIGLELVRQYVNRDDIQVFAAARNPDAAHALNELASRHRDRLVVIRLDVGDESSIYESVKIVEQHTSGIDVLINNAGVNPPGNQQSLTSVRFGLFMDVLGTNTVGPLIVAQAYMDLLRHSDNPRVTNISTTMGSISTRGSGGNYAYSTSKAALNMVSRLLGNDLRSFGGICIALDPGWVQTDMGGASAPLTVEQSASGIIKIVSRLTRDDSGEFLSLRRNGGRHEW